MKIMSCIKEARELLSRYDKSKDYKAFIQGMEILADLKQNAEGAEKKVAENLFNTYLTNAAKWYVSLENTHKEEVERTKDIYIQQGYSESIASTLRLIEIIEDKEGIMVYDFLFFVADLIKHGLMPES